LLYVSKYFKGSNGLYPNGYNMNDTAIRIENLNKLFRVFHEPPLTFQKAIYNLLKGRKNHQDLWVLKDISFSLKKRESVGLIGANASGKTTLLRIIANIYSPTTGSISVDGRVAAFLELGSGFRMEFTGIENLYLYGAVFGLSRREIKEKIPHIREFSELGDFLDVPLRQYSFGMRMRLAFALAMNISPDILLIDEALAVGDLSFKEKCIKKIDELKREGKTLLLVSQYMDEIERLCDKTILLDKGRIRSIGPTRQVIDEYKKMMQERR
jgi:ABC-type polysaccharide/polyol phosphate transport system ATPase subunit